MGTGSFPGVRCGRGVTLTLHPLLVPRSKIEYSYTSTLPKGLRGLRKGETYLQTLSIARAERDGTRAETRFRLSPKRTCQFKSMGTSVQSTTGSRGVRISSSNDGNAGQTTFRGKVELYWLPTQFACFPFTSPPVRHRVPPGSERAVHFNNAEHTLSIHLHQVLRGESIIYSCSSIYVLTTHTHTHTQNHISKCVCEHA